MSQQRKIRVAVVFGGRSAEHAVSCVSAGNVLAAIDPARYEVIPIGITREGQWVLTDGDPARLAIADGRLPSVESPSAARVPATRSGTAGGPGTAPQLSTAQGPGVAPDRGATREPAVSPVAPHGTRASGLAVTGAGQVPQALAEVDVVLPLLHGAYGEDGTIQGLLELAGVRYAGAGVFASAAGMDKEYMKLIFKARGLPLGPYVVVRDRDWGQAAVASAGPPAAVRRKRVLDEISELGWPVFVKPARGGSSIGTSKVSDVAQLYEAIETAREHDPKVLVEAAIAGLEIECGVLEGIDGGPPDTSVPGQVRVAGDQEFYDFEAKYLDSATSMVIPAPIPAEHSREIRRLAAAAFDALSCEGLARVDFFYTPDGRVLVNEINTMPGITPGSGFPLMWAATGVPLRELIDRILQATLRRPVGLR
ncbi:MAG TPA: D-alanine--D-alanine ligase family protein [Streptosporangiaceae bacterium]|nr:D-alanine--D-alanine ligase family protein [Streptosporangiaceae bacterium]